MNDTKVVYQIKEYEVAACNQTIKSHIFHLFYLHRKMKQKVLIRLLLTLMLFYQTRGTEFLDTLPTIVRSLK